MDKKSQSYTDPRYQHLRDLDNQTFIMCKTLANKPVMEPDERIIIAEHILMIQRDRKAAVIEIMQSLGQSVTHLTSETPNKKGIFE